MSEEIKEYTIYKLYCKDPSVKEVYIGKTVDLKRRKREHKEACTTETHRRHNLNVYVFIRAHGGFLNWDFVVLDKLFGLKRDAEKLETKYMELTWSQNLNVNRSFVTEERKEEKKRKEAKHKREVWKQNSEIINKRRRENYKKDPTRKKEECKRYYAKNAERLRQEKRDFRKNNREEYNKKARERYHKIKDKIKERTSKPYKCPYCLKIVKHGGKAKHFRTVICKTVQFALPFDPTLHKMCSVCNTKILIKDESFMHNCKNLKLKMIIKF